MPRKFALKPYEPKPHYVPAIKKTEEGVQRRVCSYLRNHYPHVFFRSDTASGMMLSEHQRMVHHSQQSGPAQPDLMIFYPREGYHGLLIELKAEGVVVWSKSGQLRKNAHIQAQAEVLSRYRQLGYRAEFAIGFDEAVNLIDEYMGKPQNAELAF